MARSLFLLTHHFVVGFASLCHGSSHDLPLSAAPLHPSTRGACRGPRLRRLEASQKRAFASTGIPPWLKQHSICQRPTRHRPEPCIFEAKILRTEIRHSGTPSLMIGHHCPPGKGLISDESNATI